MAEHRKGSTDDLIRQFKDMIASMGLDELTGLTPAIDRAMARAGARAGSGRRTSLRQPRRDSPVVMRVRMDLKGAKPPIWRRIDMRSDLTLDIVHQVIQASFEWMDYHLYRFSIGGDPFDWKSECFRGPGDNDDSTARIVTSDEVRLDESLAKTGDVLHYVYDYGDCWDIKILLEEILPLTAGAPAATCVDGRRAAPPEDCEGIRSGEDLAEILPDPAEFDVDEVNDNLAEFDVDEVHDNLSEFSSGETGLELRPDLVILIARLNGKARVDAQARAQSLTQEPLTSADEREQALRPIMWFLQHVGTKGLTLTAAGYLRPVDVIEAAGQIPAASLWYGERNRESQTIPVLYFREGLQSVGLLRKAKGRLDLTKAGTKAMSDPEALWRHLIERLPAGKAGTFAGHAGLLLLLHVASSRPGAKDPYARVAAALNSVGWRAHGDGLVMEHDAMWADEHTQSLLRNLVPDGSPPTDGSDHSYSRVAVDLARACLVGDRPT